MRSDLSEEEKKMRDLFLEHGTYEVVEGMHPHAHAPSSWWVFGEFLPKPKNEEKEED